MDEPNSGGKKSGGFRKYLIIVLIAMVVMPILAIVFFGKSNSHMPFAIAGEHDRREAGMAREAGETCQGMNVSNRY